MADLNFLNVDTGCSGIEVSTTTAGKTFLQYIIGLLTKDFSAIKSYKIKWSANCCTETEVILPVLYDLVVVYNNCVIDDSNVIIDLNLSGINKDLIDDTTISYSLDGGINYITAVLTSDILPVIEITVPIPGTYPDTVDLFLKFSNLDGFEYIINEPLVFDGPTACVIGQPDSNIITYPTLPVEVVIDGGTGYLDLNTLMGSDPALSGVYQVIICEETLTSEICVQNHIFLECTIKCDVIGKLVQCKDSDVLFYYDALRYSNDCTLNVTYSEVCAIYELLIYKITTTGCYSPWDDCNCSGTTNIVSQNNNSKTTVRNCGTCNG